MSEFIGSKFDQSLTTTEIARRIRAEIKAAVKSGELPQAKYSIRTKYFSMGSSIDITLSETPFPVLNPAYLATEDKFGIRRHTPEAIALVQKLEGMMRVYNRDNSDISTDYFDVRFYGHVCIDWRWEEKEREALTAPRCA